MCFGMRIDFYGYKVIITEGDLVGFEWVDDYLFCFESFRYNFKRVVVKLFIFRMFYFR